MDRSRKLSFVSASLDRQLGCSNCSAGCGDRDLRPAPQNQPGSSSESLRPIDLPACSAGAPRFDLVVCCSVRKSGLCPAVHKPQTKQLALSDTKGTGTAADVLSNRKQVDIRDRIADLQLRIFHSHDQHLCEVERAGPFKGAIQYQAPVVRSERALGRTNRGVDP